MAKVLINRGGLSNFKKKEIGEDAQSINNNRLDKANLPKLHPRSFRFSLEDQDMLRELTKKLDQEVRMSVNDSTVLRALIRYANKATIDDLVLAIKETVI
jgi:hypothetical protein